MQITSSRIQNQVAKFFHSITAKLSMPIFIGVYSQQDLNLRPHHKQNWILFIWKICTKSLSNLHFTMYYTKLSWVNILTFYFNDFFWFKYSPKMFDFERKDRKFKNS